MMPFDPYAIDDPTPAPQPAPSLVVPQWVLLALVVAGLFLPRQGGCEAGPSPNPKPGPDPAPIVDPSETVGSWVVVVEETQDRTAEVAMVLTSDVWVEIESRGLKKRRIDQDSPEADPYKPIALTVGFPAVIVLKPDGKVLAKQKLPNTPEEFDSLIRKATGR